MTATSSSHLADGGGGAPEPRYRRLIDAHFAGRPSPAGEQELRRHLVTCPACRGYYDRHLLLGRIVCACALPMSDRCIENSSRSYRHTFTLIPVKLVLGVWLHLYWLIGKERVGKCDI